MLSLDDDNFQNRNLGLPLRPSKKICYLKQSLKRDLNEEDIEYEEHRRIADKLMTQMAQVIIASHIPCNTIMPHKH